MSDHLPELQPEHKDSKLPNQPFFSWLKDQTTLFVSQLFGVAGFLSFVFALIYYGYNGFDKSAKFITPESIQMYIYIAHLVILAIFIGWLISILDNNKEGDYRVNLTYEKIFGEGLKDSSLKIRRRSSKRQLRKFKLYFLWFWLGMFILYLAFTLKALFEKTKDFPKDSYEGVEVVNYLIFPFLTFALNNLGLLFIFWCFTVLFLPLLKQKSIVKQKLLVYFSGALIFAFTALFPLFIFAFNSSASYSKTYLTTTITLFDAVSGTLNAVVLALLIARLDSKLVGLPSWLIGVLYLYAAVQPLFVAFEQPGDVFNAIKTGVLIVVFIFKVYFFFIITYTMQTGRMLNYLFCFPTLNKRVDSIFDNQYLIKIEQEHGDFGFLIKKKNANVYLSNVRFENKDECREQIEELRELMKKESSYYIRKSCGTYFVEVIESNENKICHSNDLKSEEEAENLIAESVEKIPYCKTKFS